MMDWVKERIGTRFDFFGAYDGMFKLGNNVTKVYTLVEDKGDGYRSYCDGVEEVAGDPGGFFDTPLDRVYIRSVDTEDFDGFELRSIVDDHVWLRAGTDHSDIWYPCCEFFYSPREVPPNG